MERLDRVKAGSEAGILAAATVALLFFVLDLFSIQPFATPGFLATRWFGPGGYEIDVNVIARVSAIIAGGFQILVYTLFHFLTFAVLGIVAAFGLRWTAGPTRSLLQGAIFGLTICSTTFYLGSFLLGGLVFSDLPGFPAVLAANILAGLVIGGVLHWATVYQGRKTEEERAPTG